MDTPFSGTVDDRSGLQSCEGSGAQNRAPDEIATDGVGTSGALPPAPKPATTARPFGAEQTNATRENTSTTKKAEGGSRAQKAKENTQKLVAPFKLGLSKATGAGKTPGAPEQGKVDKKAEKAAKKTGVAKQKPDEPKDAPELRVTFPDEASSVPRVDVVAVHDIDETLQKAWVYRKRSKRRVNDPRGAFGSGAINSYDGERGVGTAGSPAPGRQKRMQTSSGGKKRTAEDSKHSIERWRLAISATSTVEEQPEETQLGEPSVPERELTEQSLDSAEADNDYPFLSMLASVPEDEDGVPGSETSDFGFRQRRSRRKPSLLNDRRRPAGRISTIDEDTRVPSVGEAGEGRPSNAEVLSDRQSSLDPGIERLGVNWLSDPEMLPREIPGARVMCYTYKSTENVASPSQYLATLAEDLIKRLVSKRTSDRIDYGRVPIVLVGLGFGALVVQEAACLLNKQSDVSNPDTDISIVAGVILLDPPSPSPNKDVYPRSRSQEAKKTWTQDWLGKTRTNSTTPATKIDTYYMWTNFIDIAKRRGFPVIWHYSASTTSKPAPAFKSLDVSYLPKQSTTAHRLSRFEGPNDVDYRSILDNMKRSLIVKCATTKSEKLASCLADFLREKFPVDIRDQRSQTALHLAIYAARVDAIQRLLYQGKASVTKKDWEGRSPLNIAVQEAAQKTRGLNEGPDPEVQIIYTHIIKLLMKSGAHVDDKDNDGKTPWAYADKEEHEWIRRLKDKHVVFGSSSTTSATTDSVRPPQSGSQREACDAFDMILAEVFLQKKRDRLSEAFNFDMTSVYDVIYKGSSGVSQVLAASRPEQLTEDKVRCRWIHVPSNNEQWVHDLMVSMGIQDGSMSGQRHEGSRLIDRYMMPQARRYKHYLNTPKRTQPDTRQRGGLLNNADSSSTVVFGSQDFLGSVPDVVSKQRAKVSKTPLVPEITRTESDAVVIFMPILGFEKHRHRKFLTQAFREADSALQIARARDSSPDARPSANANSRKRTQTITAETSDDGESSTEEESSRIYRDPSLKPVIQPRARQQIRKRREAQLLRGYLDSKHVRPVHCRRTLDQFSYYMLNSTEARDKSQVAYRWAKSPEVEAKNRPIIMVDQLWLWAFRDGTVITSSPNTWDAHEDFNLSNVVVKELRHNKDRPIIKSVEDLLHLILKTSVDFFRRKGPANCQFHECFQSSINGVSEQQGQLFEKFRNTTKRLHDGTLDPVERKKEIEFLFSLDEETELLVEIMDIQDELTIVKTILGQQQDVLEKLLRLYPKRNDEGADEEGIATVPGGLGKGELLVLQNLVQLLRDQTPPTELKASLTPTSALKNASQGDTKPLPADEQEIGQLPKTLRLKGKEKEVEQPKSAAPVKGNILQNRDLMYETIGIVENNIRIVTDMLAYAQKVESSLENLLDLKQKHANGWEARFAREGSEESQRQGNIILVFTLVTVVFLPLSFITSFFALNIDIFPTNPRTEEPLWPIGQVSGYLFGFSAVIFIPLIFLALYVNKLITNVKKMYKQLLTALREPEALLNHSVVGNADNHDSDDEKTYIERYTIHTHARTNHHGMSAARTRAAGFNGDNEASSSDDEGGSGRYAPMFGRYHFHRKIPLLRNLWEYRQYRERNSRQRDNRWRDKYIRSYPLQYYHEKLNLWVVMILFTILAYFGSAKHERAKARYKRRVRTKIESSESSSETSDGSSSPSEQHDRVARRDFGITVLKKKKKAKSLNSDYWKPSGLRLDMLEADPTWDLERRSNQAWSIASSPGDRDNNSQEETRINSDQVGRRGALKWLGIGRSRAGTLDEEKEVGDSRSVLKWRRGKGVKVTIAEASSP